MTLFEIVHENLFKPLCGKYRAVYVDCLELIYQIYQNELSFGADREVVLEILEQYFNRQSESALIFEEEQEIATDARAKASAILRRLKESGWLEYEVAGNYRVKINLCGYAVPLLEAFRKIVKNEEIEYQGYLSQIYATLNNQDSYAKPYEYIIQRVAQNTQELMTGLKRLSTDIKKRIDTITNEKTANEIVRDFFDYHQEIGSKAYHRLKTSDNISYFRLSILEKLQQIFSDTEIFERAVDGYMEIEQQVDRGLAETELRHLILGILSAYHNYDDIVSEIDHKHNLYLGSAVARAKFLLTNSNNAQGKLSRILGELARKLNGEETLNLYDQSPQELTAVFQLFPQSFLDSDSLYTVPVTRQASPPTRLEAAPKMSKEERDRRRAAFHAQNASRFSRKNIESFVQELLREQSPVLASSLSIVCRRDFIRLIMIRFYGRDAHTNYRVAPLEKEVWIGSYRFRDFVIERRE